MTMTENDAKPVSSNSLICCKCGGCEDQGSGWKVPSFWQSKLYGYMQHEQCDGSMCTETVNRGEGRWSNFQPCGRATTQLFHGDLVCNVHAGVLRRRRAKDEEYNARQAASTAAHDRGSFAVEILKELGIHASVYYHSSHNFSASGYTDKVIVDPVEILTAMGIEIPAQLERNADGETQTKA